MMAQGLTPVQQIFPDDSPEDCHTALLQALKRCLVASGLAALSRGDAVQVSRMTAQLQAEELTHV
jgi:hypothetical protein